MSDAEPIVRAPIALTMLPGAGPACEGADCLPAGPLTGPSEPLRGS